MQFFSQKQQQSVLEAESWRNDLFVLAYALTDCRNKASELIDDVLSLHAVKSLSTDRSKQISIYQALCRRWVLSMKHFKQDIDNVPNIYVDADISQYLCQLPVYQKIVIVLVDILGLTYKEVASVIDADKKRVCHWLSSARQSMIAKKKHPIGSLN